MTTSTHAFRATWRLVLAVALLLGACGSGGGDAKTMRVEGTEMAFDAPSSVVAGTYDVTFANVGQVFHELAFEDPGGTVVARRSIGPGETATFEVHLTPGAWKLACHEIGHYEAGMVRPLEVTAEA